MTQFDANVNLQDRVISYAQARIIKHLLHDTCFVTPAIGANPTVDRLGVKTSDAPVKRQYNGLDDIPCRADPQTSFRPDELKYQVSTADEVDLHLPWDLTVEETDVVTLRGHDYKIRKLIDDGSHDLTKIAKIFRVSTELNT